MKSTEFVEDEYYLRFVKPSWGTSSQKKCRNAFYAYLTFYHDEKGLSLTPRDILQRKIDDMKNPPLEQGLVEREWLEFVEWLKNGYQKRNLKRTKVGAITVREYSGVIKKFFKDFSSPLSSLASLPKTVQQDKYGKVENKKINVRAKEVKKLLSVMKSNKDKAITLLMFQSGMDLSTVFSLRYRDVKNALASNGLSVLSVRREKSGFAYRTCLGRESIAALKTYLDDKTKYKWKCNRCGKSWNVKRNSCPFCKKEGDKTHKVLEERKELQLNAYLFISRKSVLASTIAAFETRFRRYGLLAGLVTEDQLQYTDFSPARPYILRSAFKSILTYCRMDRDLVEYMMGHVDPYGGAYLNLTDEEIIKRYAECEQHLSVSELKELEDVEKRFKGELKKRDDIIEGMETRLKEMEERERSRVEVIKGDSKIDVQTVLKVIESIESHPKLLKELLNGMAQSREEKEKK